MKFENLKYLPEIVRYKDEASEENLLEICAPQFLSNIFISETIYPNWVQDWDDKDELLAQIDSDDLMDPINAMMEKSGLELLTPEELADGRGYYYVAISFAIKPLPEFKGLIKQDALNAFLIPYEDEAGQPQVKTMVPRHAFLGHFHQLKNAELLEVNSADERDRHYLQALSEAVELICNEFKITTGQNQGNFAAVVDGDPKALLEEFIAITHAADFQDKKTIATFKKQLKMIQEKPEKYKDILVEKGYFDEEADIDTHYFTQYLLAEFLCAYDTDWKMEHAELSEFISEEIGQRFEITFEETGQRPDVIAEKTEAESNYTLLNISTQGDSYSFFVCRKDEKDRILDLAKKLHFPIEAY